MHTARARRINSTARTTDRQEEREQARLVKWSHLSAVRAVMPELARLHHSPNGGQRSAFTGAQMKALGTKPGWPDLVLPMRDGGVAIEMKRPDGTGRTSPEQTGWLDWLTACGWTVAVCTSADDARVMLCHALGIQPDSVPGLDP